MIAPQDFLNQSKYLLNIAPANEINCRSAISRSYYYLYHETLNYLETHHRNDLSRVIRNHLSSRGVLFDRNRIDAIDRNYLQILRVNLHSIIPNTLRSLHKRNEGRDFDGFRDDRNDADYELSFTFNLTDSRQKVTEMETLANNIQR